MTRSQIALRSDWLPGPLMSQTEPVYGHSMVPRLSMNDVLRIAAFFAFYDIQENSQWKRAVMPRSPKNKFEVAGRRTYSIGSEVKPICPSCGYDLAGLELDRCPECGARVWVQMMTDGRVPKESLILINLNVSLICCELMFLAPYISRLSLPFTLIAISLFARVNLILISAIISACLWSLFLVVSERRTISPQGSARLTSVIMTLVVSQFAWLILAWSIG